MSVGDTCDFPRYRPPTSGILSLLPNGLIPYGELIRIDKPFPILSIYFLFLWGTLLAASIAADPITPLTTMVITNLLLAVNSALVRGLACAWNDVLDSDVDAQVVRTHLRPMARGALSHRQAMMFIGLQFSLEIVFIQSLPAQFTYYSIPWFVLIGLYPAAKRVTAYTPVSLGLAVGWGVLLGVTALNEDPLSSKSHRMAAGFLYGSNIVWTIGNDLIYAHQDIQDDRKAGINSMAVRHEKSSKAILLGLALVQLSLLTLTGVVMEASAFYYLGTCGCTLLSLWFTFGTVNLGSPQDCSQSFKRGNWLTNGAVTIGLLSEYLKRRIGA